MTCTRLCWEGDLKNVDMKLEVRYERELERMFFIQSCDDDQHSLKSKRDTKRASSNLHRMLNSSVESSLYQRTRLHECVGNVLPEDLCISCAFLRTHMIMFCLSAATNDGCRSRNPAGSRRRIVHTGFHQLPDEPGDLLFLSTQISKRRIGVARLQVRKLLA